MVEPRCAIRDKRGEVVRTDDTHPWRAAHDRRHSVLALKRTGVERFGHTLRLCGSAQRARRQLDILSGSDVVDILREEITAMKDLLPLLELLSRACRPLLVVAEYDDLVQAGAIDPTKVVRSALQNAASIPSLLLTTEAVITQIPDESLRGSTSHGGM